MLHFLLFVHASKDNFEKNHEENQKIPDFYQLFVSDSFEKYPYPILLLRSDVTAILLSVNFNLIYAQPFLKARMQTLE
jgi:hypothetical protein